MVNTLTKTVLIVEDDEQINAMYHKQLSASGFSCESALSIQQALEVLNTFQPDVIVLDLTLGDGHGSQVLDYIRNRGYQNTQIVIVSADAFSTHHDLIDYGVDHVLLKPVSPRGLSVLLHELLIAN